jgi:hypothetical protein
MPILVKDHAALHESVARATLAGGAATLAGMFLPAGFRMATLALALAAAVVPPSSWRAAAWLVWGACAAGGAALVGGAWGGLGAALVVGGLLARGLDGPHRLAAGLLGAVGMLAATSIAQALHATDALAFLPSGLETLALGASSGLVVGVSSIGRQLEYAPVLAPAAPVPQLEGEIGELLTRAALAHREAIAAMGADAPAARAAADDLIGRLERFGRHWHDVEHEAARSRGDELRGRVAQLAARVEATADPLARVEFERARDAVAAQLGYLDEIERGRERAVARLTHQVALLERLRLAAVRHRCVDAARLGEELQPVVEELSQAGGELDLSAEVLAEGEALLRLPS